ncbi:hypothetical protein [Tenacibaculum sp.]|uniref:hypothetical protein n=1 Tax=Tenacibaculum sp. TaxID=1906242 RepID=UPI003D0D47BE
MTKCSGVNDVKKISTNVLPKDSVELKAGNNISITTEDLGDKKIYTIGYVPFALPTISVTNNSQVTKVGVNIPSVTFTGNIVQGSNPIIRRSMTPDKGLDLTSEFTWQESNVLGTSPGLWPQFSGTPLEIEVEDDEMNVVTKQVGVEFRHLFYMGYSDKDVLTENEIKALSTQDLLTNILSKYSSYTYNYSVIPVYIYWVYPIGSPEINSAEEGPLPIPLKKDLLTINITDAGITKSYRVVRTAVKTKLINSTIKLL